VRAGGTRGHAGTRGRAARARASRRGSGTRGAGPQGACDGACKGCTKGLQGAHREEERGGEEREGEGRGAHLGDPNFGDLRLQNLGHHGGERERWERRLLRGRIEMRERDQGRGRAWGWHGRQGRAGRVGPGRAGLGRAGLGRTMGQNPVACTTTDRKSIREAKSETRLSNTRD
jgi:hypothetical protein